MYINNGYQITNTPSNIIAAYNTWPYWASQYTRYQHVPVYYTGADGRIYKWNSWNPPPLKVLPGGQFKGTPTRTGGFYVQNISH